MPEREVRKGAHRFYMGGAQVQSLTPTSLEHFGPLRGGGGMGLKPPTARGAVAELRERDLQ